MRRLAATVGADGNAVDARAYRDSQTDYIEAANLLERYLVSDC